MKFILTILLSVTIHTVYSQELKLINNFSFEQHSYDTTTISYRFFTPNLFAEKKYPLVIALHGAGERGNDNQKQMEFHRLATVWVDSLNQLEHPCFVVAPQCPEEQKWVDINWGSNTYDFRSTPISNELATVSNLIDSLIAQYPIDKNRIYVTGLSMGGFGSWYLLMNNPNRFAAAIIFSGAADPEMACYIKDVPIWNFHGDIDTAVPVEGSRNMIEAIANCGKDILLVSDPNNKLFWDTKFKANRILSSTHLYTEYKDKGHVIWAESYNNWQVREWMFLKRLIKY